MTNVTSATELDSHANSQVVGCNAEIIEDTGKVVHVSGFTEKLGKPLTVPVVTAAVIYDCGVTGESHVLIINNALYIKDMVVNLIPPMMMRLAGLIVDECPKFLANSPSETNHSIYFEEHDLRIPLHLKGTISYIPTRRPTMHELRVNEEEYLLMTPSTMH